MIEEPSKAVHFAGKQPKPMSDEERLDLLVECVCAMHNALVWSDRCYVGVYGDNIKSKLLPLLDDLKARGKW